jgi:serine/threonine protein kinase
MSPSPFENLEAGVRIGDFRIVRRIGAGGMGIVYLAQQVSLGRPVALKILGGALAREADIARFRREAQAVARLNHPGIAAVYFVGQDEQLCYMAMEYVQGISLRRLIDRLAAAEGSPLTLESAALTEPPGDTGAPAVRFDDPTKTFLTPDPGDTARTVHEPLTQEARRLIISKDYLRRCCEIVADAATALDHAHRQGVVHRDVKPENLLIDRHLRVHVIDFGIARFFEDTTLTVTGALVGTPSYMSPEQVTGRFGVDQRTDVYSLGVVLYELLALRRPITDATREGVLRQIVTKPLPPVSWRNRGVPADLEALVHRATAKDLDERYQTAADLATDLRNWLAGRPVSASPYRYRFDVREVVTARPPGVLLASTWLFFAALFCLVNSLQSLWVSVSRRGPGAAAKLDMFFVTVGVVYLFVGRGLLLAHSWARWACVALGLANIVGLVLLILALAIRSGKVAGTYWFPILVLTVACWSATVTVLLGRTAGRWFRLAARLRSEHKRRES